MPYPRYQEPKPYRLYVALYNLGPVYHWAFVVRGRRGTFLLDATIEYGRRQYRKREWENDLSKQIISVLCDVMDLEDDTGVEYFLRVSESAPMPGHEDENFCQTWVENVLQKAGEDGHSLRASIGQIWEIMLQEASNSSDRRFGDPLKVIEPFN